MAKLNGASALPPEALTFLESYKTLLRQMPEPEATEATIKLMYQTYYREMGGAGAPPELPAQSAHQARDNVTAFKRPPAARKQAAQKSMDGPAAKPRLPVALIFACLVVVYVGIRYYLR